MNENDELLLTDTPPSTPNRPQTPLQEDDLLLEEINQDFSSTENAFQFPQNLQKAANETWSSIKNWKNQTKFIWQQDSSEQQEMEPIFSPNKNKVKQPNDQQNKEFPYLNLMKSLQVALELIQEKEKTKEIALFSSVKHIKSVSVHNERPQKKVKTQRMSKQQAREVEKRASQRKKYEHMRKSATEPDENFEMVQKQRPRQLKIQKYAANKVINQVDEKDSPTLKSRKDQERQRTKQEFLASMTNWQQRRKLKQLQMMEKQQIQLMNGVTFTPTINLKSKLLMKKKGTMLPIYQRDIKCKRSEIQGLITPKPVKGKK